MNGKVAPYLLIGATAGLASGLLGVGGGIVIVPMLVLVAGVTQHQAHATSLLAVIPVASMGAITYAMDGAVDFGSGAFLAFGAIVGAPLGAKLMASMRETTLKVVFGVLLIGLGAFMVVA